MNFARVASLERAPVDVLVLPVVEGLTPQALYPGLDTALSGALGRAAERGFGGGFAATAFCDGSGAVAAPRVMLLGLGDRRVIDRTRLNHAMEMGLRQAGPKLPARLGLAWDDQLGPEVTRVRWRLPRSRARSSQPSRRAPTRAGSREIRAGSTG